MAYPVKMREKALEALRKGYTKTEVNKMLGLSNNVKLGGTRERNRLIRKKTKQ